MFAAVSYVPFVENNKLFEKRKRNKKLAWKYGTTIACLTDFLYMICILHQTKR